MLWENGTKLKTFVHADEPVGWFVFENLPDTVSPEIIAPRYSNPDEVAGDNSHAGPALGRLGYKQGTIQKEGRYDHFPSGRVGEAFRTMWSSVGSRKAARSAAYGA